MANTSQETEELYNLSNELSESAINSAIHSEEEDEIDNDEFVEAMSYNMQPLANCPIRVYDFERFNLTYKHFHYINPHEYKNHDDLYDIVGVVSIIGQRCGSNKEETFRVPREFWYYLCRIHNVLIYYNYKLKDKKIIIDFSDESWGVTLMKKLGLKFSTLDDINDIFISTEAEFIKYAPCNNKYTYDFFMEHHVYMGMRNFTEKKSEVK